MVRFIATDLDGTLLDGHGELPRAVFPLVEELAGRGILFAPASGRQYANLKKLFAPVADKIVFICENGALVKYRGETLRLTPVPEPMVKEALAAIRSLPGLRPVLCGARSAYIEDVCEPFRSLSVQAYTNCGVVESLDSVLGRETVCKIAVYDELGAAENGIKVLPERLPALRTILSGTSWCDVSAPEANKGEAVRSLRETFGLKREECAAFGDHMNDYEMLAECGRAYVPENAYPPLKKLIGRIVPSNGEGGVLQKIHELLEEQE